MTDVPNELFTMRDTCKLYTSTRAGVPSKVARALWKIIPENAVIEYGIDVRGTKGVREPLWRESADTDEPDYAIRLAGDWHFNRRGMGDIRDYKVGEREGHYLDVIDVTGKVYRCRYMDGQWTIGSDGTCLEDDYVVFWRYAGNDMPLTPVSPDTLFKQPRYTPPEYKLLDYVAMMNEQMMKRYRVSDFKTIRNSGLEFRILTDLPEAALETIKKLFERTGWEVSYKIMHGEYKPDIDIPTWQELDYPKKYVVMWNLKEWSVGNV